MSLEDQTGVYHLQTKLLFLESFNDQIRVSYYFLLTFDGNLVVMFSQSEDRIWNLDMEIPIILFLLVCILFYAPKLLQGHRKHGEPVEPKIIPSDKNDEMLHWNEHSMRQCLRKSRFGRGKETTFIMGDDVTHKIY